MLGWRRLGHISAFMHARRLAMAAAQFSTAAPTTQGEAHAAFVKFCRQQRILAPRVAIGDCVLGSVAQRGLFATADIAAGEPIAAVPHAAMLGRASYANRRLVALTDRLYPRGSPSLRPLTTDELMKEEQPTLTTMAPSLQLAVLLVLEEVNPQSPYRAWLDVMPRPPVAEAGHAITTPPPPVCNAAYLDAAMVELKFRNAAAQDTISLRGRELDAMVLEVAERMSGFQGFLRDTIQSHFVVKTMLERVAKARFDGNLQAAESLFRWAFSLAHSRVNEGNTTSRTEHGSVETRLEPWKHLALTAADADATAALRDAALARSPTPPTPSIAPLLDFINHADGDRVANVVLEAGGVAPLSPLERRAHVMSLRRLGDRSRADDGGANAADRPDPATLSDQQLTRHLFLRATVDIEAGSQLFLWYAPQIESNEDTFLEQYGFIPQKLTAARRDEQLRALRGMSDEIKEAQRALDRQSRRTAAAGEQPAVAPDAAAAAASSGGLRHRGRPKTVMRAPPAAQSSVVAASRHEEEQEETIPVNGDGPVAPALSDSSATGSDGDALFLRAQQTFEATQARAARERIELAADLSRLDVEDGAIGAHSKQAAVAPADVAQTQPSSSAPRWYEEAPVSSKSGK